MVDAFQATMEGLSRALTVGHVATAPLSVAFPTQSVAEVRAWAEPAKINNVPVRLGESIVGVLENLNGDLHVDDGGSPPSKPDGAASVRTAQRDLATDMLIDASRPLTDLVRELLRPPHYRLVLLDGQLPSIVTPSDLAKLPMRVLVYTQIAHLEATMLEAIRARFEEEEDAVSTLDAGAQAQIDDALRNLHRRNLDPKLLEVTSLKQKAQILVDAGAFTGTAADVSDELGDLYERLRNPLVHAAAYVDDSLPALRQLEQHLQVIASRTEEATAWSGGG